MAKKLANQLRKKAKKAAEAAEVRGGPLEGKKVRLVGWRETALFANMEGSVVQHREAEGTLKVQVATSTFSKVSEQDVYLLTGSEKAKMAQTLDLRRLTKAEKEAGLAAAGGQVALCQPDTYLEGPEFCAAWTEILQRGQGQGRQARGRGV